MDEINAKYVEVRSNFQVMVQGAHGECGWIVRALCTPLAGMGLRLVNELIEMPMKLFLVICLCFSTYVKAESLSVLGDFASSLQSKAGQIETAFSPEGGAEKLVLKVIDNSERRLKVAAYSFTSANIVRALIRAKRRGVDVEVLVDEKANKGKANQAAMNLLVNEEIPTRTISSYAIHHDKYIIADGMTVQTGSFNFSAAAAKSNSENVIVIWNQNSVASSYEKHWDSRWIRATDYVSSY